MIDCIRHIHSLFSLYDLKQIGSSVHLETLAYKPTLQRTFRLNHIKQLARNLMTPILADHDRTHTHTHQFGIHQVAPELIPKGHLSANGNFDQQHFIYMAFFNINS